MLDSTNFRLFQQLLLELHGLNINYFESFDSDLSAIDHRIRNQTLNADRSYHELRKVLRSVPFGTIYTIQDSFLLSYVVFLANPKKESFYVFGPYRSTLLAECDYETIRNENHLTSEELEAIKIHLQEIPKDVRPHIPILAAKNLLQTLHETLTISFHDNSIEISPYVPKEDIVTRIHHVETSYHHESMLMLYISEGNHTKATQEARYFLDAPKTYQHTNSIMAHRGLLYTSNTLFRKAAQSIGIHPLFLDEISTRFARQLSFCKTHEQLDETYLCMVNDYCTLCREYEKQKYSEPVQKIINYILSNISTDLTPSDISQFINFSPSYISRKFKEEVGSTLGNYITEQRVRIAKKLLEDHNMQVQDVASYVGISDWNYFTKLFKKYTGTTPSNYRKNIIR